MANNIYSDEHIRNAVKVLLEKAVKIESLEQLDKNTGKGLVYIAELSKNPPEGLEKLSVEIEGLPKRIIDMLDKASALSLVPSPNDYNMIKGAYEAVFEFSRFHQSALNVLKSRAVSGFALYAFSIGLRNDDNIANALFLLPFFASHPINIEKINPIFKIEYLKKDFERAFDVIETAWDPNALNGKMIDLQLKAAEIANDFNLGPYIKSIMDIKHKSIVATNDKLTNRGKFLSVVLDKMIINLEIIKEFQVNDLISHPPECMFKLGQESYIKLIQLHVKRKTGLIKELIRLLDNSPTLLQGKCWRYLLIIFLIFNAKELENILEYPERSLLEKILIGQSQSIMAIEWYKLFDWVYNPFNGFPYSFLFKVAAKSVYFQEAMEKIVKDNRSKSPLGKIKNEMLMLITDQRMGYNDSEIKKIERRLRQWG